MGRIADIKSYEELQSFAREYLKNRVENLENSEFEAHAKDRQAIDDSLIDTLQGYRSDLESSALKPEDKAAAGKIAGLAEQYIAELIEADAMDMLTQYTAGIREIGGAVNIPKDVEQICRTNAENSQANYAEKLGRAQFCMDILSTMARGGSLGDNLNELTEVTPEVKATVLRRIAEAAGGEYGREEIYTERYAPVRTAAKPELSVDFSTSQRITADNFRELLLAGRDDDIREWSQAAMDSMFTSIYGAEQYEALKAANVNMQDSVYLDGKPIGETFGDTPHSSEFNNRAMREILSGDRRIDCVYMEKNEAGVYVPTDRTVSVELTGSAAEALKPVILEHAREEQKEEKLSLWQRLLRWLGIGVKEKARPLQEKVSFNLLEDEDIAAGIKQSRSKFDENRRVLEPVAAADRQYKQVLKLIDDSIEGRGIDCRKLFVADKIASYSETPNGPRIDVITTMNRKSSFETMAALYALHKGVTTEDMIRGDEETSQRIFDAANEFIERVSVPDRMAYAKSQNPDITAEEAQRLFGTPDFERGYVDMAREKSLDVQKLLNVELRGTVDRLERELPDVDLNDMSSLANAHIKYGLFSGIIGDVFQASGVSDVQSLSKKYDRELAGRLPVGEVTVEHLKMREEFFQQKKQELTEKLNAGELSGKEEHQAKMYLAASESRDHYAAMKRVGCVSSYIKCLADPGLNSPTIDNQFSKKYSDALAAKIQAGLIFEKFRDSETKRFDAVGAVGLDIQSSYLSRDTIYNAMKLTGMSMDESRTALDSVRDVLFNKKPMPEALKRGDPNASVLRELGIAKDEKPAPVKEMQSIFGK